MEHDPSVWKLVDEATEHLYPLDQPAATLWYHDHRMDFTGPQVWRGLAGFFLVRDDVEDDLPLPRGEKEVPLMICDRAFEEDGSFRYPAIDPTLMDTPGVEGAYHQGVEGDVILVNGAPWPVLDVANTRYRFRLLNASNARRYRLTLDPPPPQGPASPRSAAMPGCSRPPRRSTASSSPAPSAVTSSSTSRRTRSTRRSRWSTLSVPGLQARSCAFA